MCVSVYYSIYDDSMFDYFNISLLRVKNKVSRCLRCS